MPQMSGAGRKSSAEDGLQCQDIVSKVPHKGLLMMKTVMARAGAAGRRGGRPQQAGTCSWLGKSLSNHPDGKLGLLSKMWDQLPGGLPHIHDK